jgi:uncharacterized protein (TIGR03067 family)
LPAAGLSAVISGGCLRYRRNGAVISVWAIKVDPRFRPARLDMRGAVAKDRRRPVFLGVYRLEGDTLTICVRQTADPRQRPKACRISVQADILEVFKRVKKR